MTSHAALVRSLEIRMQWEDVVSNLLIPTSKQEITLDTARWFIENGHISNQRDATFSIAVDLCREYIDISEKRI